MRHRTFRVAISLVAVLLAVGSLVGAGGASVGAATPVPRRTQVGPYIPADAPPGDVLRAPASMRARGVDTAGQGGPVNVVIEMNAVPLAEVFAAQQATASSQNVDAALQRSYVNSLRSAQAPVVAEASRRGKVVAQLTRLVNGVAVTGVAPRDLPALRRLPGVKAVHVVGDFKLDLGTSVPFIGGQQVLEQSGLDGRGTRIAIIDSGIDYTHRDFGGPGTADAYAVVVDNPAQLPPAYKGGALFPTQKIIGGYDFVGDRWTGSNPGAGIPRVIELSPDPNPIDLDGHGTHVAGIAAGFGVPNSSETGNIPASFIQPGEPHTVFHGVAPAAQLMAYKVCSSMGSACSGLAMIMAFDRAADPNEDGDMSDHVDAVNMSIGAVFAANPVTEQAANRAVQAGIALAVSAGNSADVPFITGAPASAERALSVASSSKPQPLYGLQITAPASAAPLRIPFIWQTWSGPLTPPVSGPLIEARTVVTLTDPSARLGCPQPDGSNPFPAGSLAGKIAVIDRGTCAVSDKGAMAEQAGAIGAIIVSTPNNPPIAFAPGVFRPTIPVVAIAYENGQALYSLLRAGTAVQVTLGPNVIGDLADVLSGFTSRGPSRSGNLKPDLTAPGSGIVSAAAGTGSGGVAFSGTSMAAPHVAGALALMKQAHPQWTAQELEAVLVNTANPEVFTSELVSPTFERAPISRAGAGRIDLAAAARADSVLLGDLLAHVGYGVQAVAGVFTVAKPITLENKGAAAKTYDLTTAFERSSPPGGVEISVSPSSLTVPAGGTGTASVTLVLRPELLAQWELTNGPQLGLGASLSKAEVAGFVRAIDRGNGQRYHVPFYVLPRAASDVRSNTDALTLAGIGPSNAGTFSLVNQATLTGRAELFHLLVSDAQDLPGDPAVATGPHDIQYVGARPVTSTNSAGAVTSQIEFAVKTYAPRMLPLETEFEINIDLDDDGNPEYIVFNVDRGQLAGSGSTGVNVVAVFDVAARTISGPYGFTDAGVWSSGMIMRVPAAAIGLVHLKKFHFWVEAYLAFPGSDPVPLPDRAPDYDSVAFDPARVRLRPSAYTVSVPRGTSQNVSVYADVDENAEQVDHNELGMMIYYRDNVPGEREADVVWIEVADSNEPLSTGRSRVPAAARAAPPAGRTGSATVGATSTPAATPAATRSATATVGNTAGNTATRTPAPAAFATRP